MGPPNVACYFHCITSLLTPFKMVPNSSNIERAVKSYTAHDTFLVDYEVLTSVGAGDALPLSAYAFICKCNTPSIYLPYV